MQNKEVYTNLCSGSQGRVPNPISLHPVFLILRWYWGSASIAGNNACFTMYNTLWLYGERLYYRIVFYKKRMECFFLWLLLWCFFSPCTRKGIQAQDGDITYFVLSSTKENDGETRGKRGASADSRHLWPSAVVPYTISPSFTGMTSWFSLWRLSRSFWL